MSEQVKRMLGPTVLTEKITAELRGLRRGAKLTQVGVAEAVKWSPSKYHELEKGTVRPQPENVKVLLDMYGVDDQTRQRLLGMAEEQKIALKAARKQRNTVPGNLRQYAEYERYADVIASLSSTILPDIFRPPEYADSVAVNDRNVTDPERRSDMEEFRQERAAYLLGPDGPAMRIIIGEEALGRAAGDEEALELIKRANTLGRRRRGERIERDANPRVSVRVAPFIIGAHALMNYQKSRVMLGFDDTDLSSRVYSIDPWAEQPAYRHPDGVEHFAEMFKAVSARAPGPEETNELLDKIQAGYTAIQA